MKRAILVASGLAACLSLSACASASSGPSEILKTLGENYAHCERTVSYSASIGALNPASGATVTGQVRCPPRAEATSAAPVVPPLAPPGGT